MTFIFLFLIFLVANTIEAIAGFGSTILTLTLAGFYFPMTYLLAVIVPLNLILSGWTCLKYRQDIHFTEFFKAILPFCVIGMVLGMAAVLKLKTTGLEALFGCVIVLIGLRGLFFSQSNPKKNPFVSKSFLVLGGLMQGLYASGGPFVVAYANQSQMNKAQIRTTLSFLWLCLNTILTIQFFIQNQINFESLTLSFKLLPAILCGLYLGYKIHDHLSEKKFTQMIYLALIVAGFCRIYLSFR